LRFITRKSAAAAAALALVSVLAGCGHGHSAPTALRSSHDPLAPTGWTGYSFGGLEFAIPPGWRIDQPAQNTFRCGGANKTLYVLWYSKIGPPRGCPPSIPLTGDDNWVDIECLTGAAAHVDLATSSSTLVGKTVLDREDYVGGSIDEYRIDRSTVSAIEINTPRESPLGVDIVNTVRPSPYHC
jgi:hypothetical protein